jgi:serine/threonine-protein kinase RsbW
MPNEPTSTDNGTIELRVPADQAFASTVRLIAASLAADAEFTLDDLDDIRLAVNEVFTCAVAGAGTRLETVIVRFDAGGSDLVVHIIVDNAPIQLDDLAGSIIRSAVDDVHIDERQVTLVKRRRPSPPDDR